MGRGSSKAGGGGSSNTELIKVTHNLPELEGSQKQIEWAKSIRERASSAMSDYIYSPKGLDVDETTAEYMIELKYESETASRKAEIKKSLKAGIESGMFAEKFSDEAFERAWSLIQKRTETTNKILSERSAKYWIEHRNESTGAYVHNSGWRMFKSMIDGKSTMRINGVDIKISDIRENPDRKISEAVKAAKGKKA